MSVPLTHTVTAIWPLPFGLLLQLAPGGYPLTNITLISSSPILSGRDVFRPKRGLGYSPQNNYTPMNSFDCGTVSSHLILNDPLEEPQVFLKSFILALVLYNFLFSSHGDAIFPSSCPTMHIQNFQYYLSIYLWK